MKLAARLTFAVLLLCCVVPAAAQPMGPDSMGPRSMMHPPGFLEHVFRPEIIMRHQKEIGLTTAQQEAITQAMAETQQGLVDKRWKFEAESQELTKLLNKDSLDEGSALAQAEKVMNIEQEIKREHLRMLIRIKNQLTPEQQAKLRQLEPDDWRGRRRGRR